MMTGRASTSAIRSSMPASMICGTAEIRNSTMELMTSGSASISTGSAARMP